MADALSRIEHPVVQCSPLLQVEGDILQQIRAETEKDVVTSRLLKQVREGVKSLGYFG